MMIKANGEYLDFNGEIDVESRIKLFEEIGMSAGDFSYDIIIQDNGFNRKSLGIPRADTVKIIYQKITSEVIDDTGQSIFTGKLQVNRVEGGFIYSTFYAGNTEWFSDLSEPLSALPLYRYDRDLTEAEIVASFAEDSGIVFPIIDTGVLVSRSYANFKAEDFIGCFYVKTLFNEIFNPKGIKVEGDLLTDPIFNKLVICANNRGQDEIENRSAYANKTADQTEVATAVILFEDDSSFPFFDGSEGNYNPVTGEYTADVKMLVRVELNLQITSIFSSTVNIFINGVQAAVRFVFGSPQISIDQIFTVPSGGIITVVLDNVGGSTTVNAGATVKFTPIFLYRAFGNSSVPQWTQMQLVSNILRLFNTLPSYNTTSKTLTIDFFNNIKNKPYVDLSEEVTIDSIDFTEFVSGYAKNNIFKYQESDDEDLRIYNISNFIVYGSGNLTIDNDYIENTKDVVVSDFTTPITYLSGIFDTSLERINFVELEEIDDKAITSVTDVGGTPRFDIANADQLFTVGDLVRFETLLTGYSGEWIVNTVNPAYIIVNGLSFGGSTTGTATLLRHKFTGDENVYLFVNVNNVSPSFFSSNSSVLIGDSTSSSTASLAYFNLLSNNKNINKVFKQSLSFGDVNNPLSYQLSLLDSYWPLFSRILSDPVKGFASGYLKKSTFEKVKSFLRPVMIQTEETRNLYYMNQNRSYKGSEVPCSLELIKLN